MPETFDRKKHPPASPRPMDGGSRESAIPKLRRRATWLTIYACLIGLAGLQVRDRSHEPDSGVEISEPEPVPPTKNAEPRSESPVVQEIDPTVRAALQKMHEQLVTPDVHKRQPLFHPKTSAFRRCEIISGIIEKHNIHFAKVGEFLGKNVESIRDKELQLMLKKQMNEVFTMTPEEIAETPDKARGVIIEGLQEKRREIAGCGLLVQSLFGLAARKFPKEYADRTSRVVQEILKAAEEGQPGAREAALALAQIAGAIESGR